MTTRWLSLAPIAFLLGLGACNHSGGSDSSTPATPELRLGDPLPGLTPEELAAFQRGKAVFEKDFKPSEGLGPHYNSTACRSCHSTPVSGGSAPLYRNFYLMAIGDLAHQFAHPDLTSLVVPSYGTDEHASADFTLSGGRIVIPETYFGSQVTVAQRNAIPIFGTGLFEFVSDATIASNADPDDLDGDGISGRESRVDGGRLGRFGWKAQVPSLAEFVRDAVAAELGMTLPVQEGLTFGRILDNDDIPDPEMDLESAGLLAAFMALLAPPPLQPASDEQAAMDGEALFASVGCASCHTPTLAGSDGPVALYSDLLLHEILPAGSLGIEDTSANMWEFRTAPLWGLSRSAPYLHSGEADTVDQAIRLHDGEALMVREAYVALSDGERMALLVFLSTL